MLSFVILQALANDHLRREDVEKLSIVLKTVSLVASYEDEPKGLTQLLDKGLTHMISDHLLYRISQPLHCHDYSITSETNQKYCCKVLHYKYKSNVLKRHCIEFGVVRIDSAIVVRRGAHTLGDNSAFVNSADQLLLPGGVRPEWITSA